MEENNSKKFFELQANLLQSAQSVICANLLLTPISSSAIVAVLKNSTIQVRSNLL